MKANMGTMDRVIRVAVAAVVAGLIISGMISGVAAIVLGVLAAVFILTSVIRFCPLYLPFGINTGAHDRGKNV